MRYCHNMKKTKYKQKELDNNMKLYSNNTTNKPNIRLNYNKKSGYSPLTYKISTITKIPTEVVTRPK